MAKKEMAYEFVFAEKSGQDGNTECINGRRAGERKREMKEGRRIDELRLAAQRYRTLLDLWRHAFFSLAGPEYEKWSYDGCTDPLFAGENHCNLVCI